VLCGQSEVIPRNPPTVPARPAVRRWPEEDGELALHQVPRLRGQQ
jgi:hypothetical protein